MVQTRFASLNQELHAYWVHEVVEDKAENSRGLLVGMVDIKWR